jgi:hypothetical protein
MFRISPCQRYDGLVTIDELYEATITLQRQINAAWEQTEDEVVQVALQAAADAANATRLHIEAAAFRAQHRSAGKAQ